MAAPSAFSALLDSNITEQLEVKRGDDLLTIVQKQCLRLGGFRCPPNPCSTMDDVESMVELWPVVFSAEEANTLGNVKSAIRSVSTNVQPHIIKQLQNIADAIYRTVKCPKLKVKETPTGEDLTAQQLWQILEPSVLIGRALINYLKGKVPAKGGAAATVPTPSPALTAVAPTDVTRAQIQSMIDSRIQSGIARALSSSGGNRGSGDGHHGGRRFNQSQGGGKRRRY